MTSERLGLLPSRSETSFSNTASDNGVLLDDHEAFRMSSESEDEDDSSSIPCRKSTTNDCRTFINLWTTVITNYLLYTKPHVWQRYRFPQSRVWQENSLRDAAWGDTSLPSENRQDLAAELLWKPRHNWTTLIDKNTFT